MQKIKKTIDNLYTEKQKLEKEKSKKSNAKGKGKASLRLEATSVSEINRPLTNYCHIIICVLCLQANIQAFDSYDYDDFM